MRIIKNIFLLCLLCPQVFAEDRVEYPDRRFLFIEDSEQEAVEASRRERIRARKNEIASRKNPSLPFDILSPNLSFDSASNTISALGGFAVAYETGVLEAQTGSFNLETYNAELKGEVKISDVSGDLIADYANFNLKSGKGELKNAEVSFEESGYRIYAENTRKLSGETFEFDNVVATTCACTEGDCSPWSIAGSWGKVTREGYGHIQNMTLRFCDVPVFYFPYIIFPAKTQRQSGLLPGRFGTGRNSGFEAQLPLFLVFDDTSDLLLTGIAQTETRYGVDAELRKVFRQGRKFEMGLTYLNEGPRNGELQGTVTDGLFDPEFDEERYMGFVDFSGSWQPGVNVVVDGNYVSDDLILREFNKDKVAPFNTRFVTSDAVLRAALPLDITFTASAEYNQSLVSDDDFVFQRLPELSLSGGDTYRPFGNSPYGLRVVTSNEASFVNFSRQASYEGNRSEFYHKSLVPFYYKNILEGAVAFDARASHYGLGERDVQEKVEGTLETTDTLASDETRFVPGFSARLGTVVEKVFDANETASTLFDLGPRARIEQVKRLKHTIEPEVKYRYVPDIDQSDNPFFDSTDRIAERNVVSYGVTQRLYSRSELNNPYALGIQEVTPEVDDLRQLGSTSLFDDAFSYPNTFSGFGGLSGVSESGSIRELASLEISQSVDIVEVQDDLIEDSNGLSDLNVVLNFIPNYHFRFGADSNIDLENGDFSSYALRAQLLDKYGDELRIRFSSIEDSLRQLEASAQINLMKQLKVGYYARYDDLEGEFIENRFGVRLISSCDCWYIDADLRDRVNPNETRFNITVTFVGLGQFGNSFLTEEEEI